MLFALTGLGLFIFCYFKRILYLWEKYYSTILYMLIGNLVADLLLFAKPLWEYSDIFGTYMFINIALMVVLYPFTVITFLRYLPKTTLGIIVYILGWTVGFVVIELISLKLSLFEHHQTWNIWFTVAHNIAMFLLVLLHSRKPIVCWLASAVVAFVVLWYFHIPRQIIRPSLASFVYPFLTCLRYR